MNEPFNAQPVTEVLRGKRIIFSFVPTADEIAALWARPKDGHGPPLDKPVMAAINVSAFEEIMAAGMPGPETWGGELSHVTITEVNNLVRLSDSGSYTLDLSFRLTGAKNTWPYVRAQAKFNDINRYGTGKILGVEQPCAN